jgi:hypothetical protein
MEPGCSPQRRCRGATSRPGPSRPASRRGVRSLASVRATVKPLDFVLQRCRPMLTLIRKAADSILIFFIRHQQHHSPSSGGRLSLCVSFLLQLSKCLHASSCLSIWRRLVTQQAHGDSGFVSVGRRPSDRTAPCQPARGLQRDFERMRYRAGVTMVRPLVFLLMIVRAS